MEKYEINKEYTTDLKLIIMKKCSDFRGDYIKAYSDIELKKIGIDIFFREDNHLISKRGVFRGLHYQKVNPEAKLIRCIKGKILDIVIDLRENSETFEEIFLIELSEEKNEMLYVPSGFAHGFLTIEESVVIYKSSNYYYADDQYGLNIINEEFMKLIDKQYKIDELIITDKDRMLPKFGFKLEGE